MKKYIFLLFVLLANSTIFAGNYAISGSEDGTIKTWKFDRETGKISLVDIIDKTS